MGRLKAEPGKDLIAYGGSAFVSALIREDLIDECTFFLNPVALGTGESVFRDLPRVRPCGSPSRGRSRRALFF